MCINIYICIFIISKVKLFINYLYADIPSDYAKRNFFSESYTNSYFQWKCKTYLMQHKLFAKI